jgi:hypothetical protein
MPGYAGLCLGSAWPIPQIKGLVLCNLSGEDVYLPQNKSCMERLYRIKRSTTHREIHTYRGIIVYLEYHNRNWVPPPPPPPSEGVSPLGPKGGEATLSYGRDSVGSQFGRLDRKRGTLYTQWCAEFLRKCLYVNFSIVESSTDSYRNFAIFAAKWLRWGTLF